MRAPAFWWRDRPSLTAKGLAPASFLYGAIAAHRLRRIGQKTNVPVICIGNFVLGGAGKTPTALAIADLLRADGHTPAFLSRGYGGRETGPILVDPTRHTALQVGDEPLLLATEAPTVVSIDRVAGARLCAQTGADIVVMDDGLQNPSLIKDLTFGVIDGVQGLGNRFCLPSGPLRAPLTLQWKLADALILIGSGPAGERVHASAMHQGKPCFRAQLTPDERIAERLNGAKVLAFAGIGRPEKFYTTLRDCGATIVKTVSFGDHRPYRAQELLAILDEGAALGCRVITTSKDFARVRAVLSENAASRIETLPVRLTFENRSTVANFIRRAIAKGGNAR